MAWSTIKLRKFSEDADPERTSRYAAPWVFERDAASCRSPPACRRTRHHPITMPRPPHAANPRTGRPVGDSASCDGGVSLDLGPIATYVAGEDLNDPLRENKLLMSAPSATCESTGRLPFAVTWPAKALVASVCWHGTTAKATGANSNSVAAGFGDGGRLAPHSCRCCLSPQLIGFLQSAVGMAAYKRP